MQEIDHADFQNIDWSHVWTEKIEICGTIDNWRFGSSWKLDIAALSAAPNLREFSLVNCQLELVNLDRVPSNTFGPDRKMKLRLASECIYIDELTLLVVLERSPCTGTLSLVVR